MGINDKVVNGKKIREYTCDCCGHTQEVMLGTFGEPPADWSLRKVEFEDSSRNSSQTLVFCPKCSGTPEHATDCWKERNKIEEPIKRKQRGIRPPYSPPSTPPA